MDKKIAQELVKLANSLDKHGMQREADRIDRILAMASGLQWHESQTQKNEFVKTYEWKATKDGINYLILALETVKGKRKGKHSKFGWSILVTDKSKYDLSQPGSHRASGDANSLEEAKAAAEAAGEKKHAGQKSKLADLLDAKSLRKKANTIDYILKLSEEQSYSPPPEKHEDAYLASLGDKLGNFCKKIIDEAGPSVDKNKLRHDLAAAAMKFLDALKLHYSLPSNQISI